MIFAWRGLAPALGASGNGDFALLYACARVWVDGGNPYDLAAVSDVWDRTVATGSTVHHVRTRGPVLLYPPSALVVFAPLAVLPWGLASLLWTLLNLGLAAGSVWAIGRLAGLWPGAAGAGAAVASGAAGAGVPGLPRGAWLLYVVGALWLAPFATSIKFGQTPVLVLALVAAGVLTRMSGRPLVAGLLLGAATAIKPQLAGLFVVYEAGRGRWNVALMAGLAAALLFGAGAARLELAAAGAAGGPPGAAAGWWESWLTQVREFPLRGDANPTRESMMRHQMLNLHYPLHTLFWSREVVRWLVYAIVGALCLAYFVVDWARGRGRAEGRAELVSLSMVAAITLLVVYHRFYDAVILLFAWALAARLVVERPALSRRFGWGQIVLLSAFAVPASAALLRLMLSGRMDEDMRDSLWWNLIVMPHEVWALVVMAVGLIWMRAALPREGNRGGEAG